MLVGDIPYNNKQHFPDKVGIVDETARYTWRETNSRVNRLANSMIDFGLKKGDRVAIISENCHQYLEFLFASAKAGLISVTLNYRLSVEQMCAILNDCEPKLVFIHEAFRNIVKPLQNSMPSIEYFVGIGQNADCAFEFLELIEKSSDDEPNVEISEQDVHRIQYTTGTTGRPKGVMLTHENTIFNCIWRVLTKIGALSMNDVVLEWMPFFAAGGQGKAISHCFLGCKTVLCKFKAETVLTIVEKEQVTCTTLNYPSFRIIQKYLAESNRTFDLKSLQIITMAGGSPFTPEQVVEILDYFNVPHHNTSIGYAMSETATTGTVQRGEDIAASLGSNATEAEINRLRSVGNPMYLGQIRVVDEDGKDLPAGEPGEIIIKNKAVMKGYWKQPDITQQVLKDGWYWTSDLGYLDVEGKLYITGRKDFLIKSGGFFVSPEEVEHHLARHPQVAEVAVVPIPDEKWGKVLKAVVCLFPGGTVTTDEIIDFCRTGLANYQVPKVVEFRDSLPREDATNKLKRKELLESEK